MRPADAVPPGGLPARGRPEIEMLRFLAIRLARALVTMFLVLVIALLPLRAGEIQVDAGQ